ncbi:MAG: DNA polymerase III subunit delta [Anaerolineae bacterium]
MLYVFHGPDDFTRNQKIAELRARFADPMLADLNLTTLDGREVSLADIRHYADSMPFMGDKRLVVVNGYLARIKGKSEEIEQLVGHLPHLPPTTDLVLAESDKLDARHPLLKAAKQLEAKVEFFGGPTKNNIDDWILNRAKVLGIAIEPPAAHALGTLVGPELRTLNSELEKLHLYVAGQRPITPADVELLVPYVEDSEDFGLANAIGQRNARRAYDQLHKQLAEDRHALAILASIATQMRGLMEVKELAEHGMTPLQIAQQKGWKNDFPAKIRLREGANFSMARLEEILELLLQTDLAIKTGQIDTNLALDSLIAQLCAGSPRR